ncbi:hypothetical protein, partial [Knoellia flava]
SPDATRGAAVVEGEAAVDGEAGLAGEVLLAEELALGVGVVSATAAAGIPRTRAASASGATRPRREERCMWGTAFLSGS